MGIAVASAVARTSVGSQDITAAVSFGDTPKAALFFFSRAGTDGVFVDEGGASYGCADGTNQWSVASWFRDAVTVPFATGYTGTLKSNTSCLLMIASSAVGTPAVAVAQASFTSFIADGVRVNWTTADGASRKVHVVFFYGSEFDVQAGTTFARGVTTTSPPNYEFNATPFQPDVVFIAGSRPNNAGTDTFSGTTTVTSTADCSFGWAAFNPYDKIFDTDGTYGGTGYTTGENEAVGFGTMGYSPVTLQFDTMYMDASYFSHVSLTPCRYFVVQFSNGFGVTHNLGSNFINQKVGYLALRWGGGVMKAGKFDLAQSVATQSFTGFGGKPKFAMLLPRCSLGDSVSYGDYRSNGNYGVALLTPDLGIAGYTQSGNVYNNVISTSNPTDLHHTTIKDSIPMTTRDGTITHMEPTVTSFDADGLTLEFGGSPPVSNIWYWPYLAFVVERLTLTADIVEDADTVDMTVEVPDFSLLEVDATEDDDIAAMQLTSLANLSVAVTEDSDTISLRLPYVLDDGEIIYELQQNDVIFVPSDRVPHV